jgi:GTP-binding protein HflX
LRRKAILLTTGGATAEMEELVYALGADLVQVAQQKRAQPDPQLYLGSGRMTEVRDSARALGADLVVVNGALKPGQIFAMERFLGEPRIEASAAGAATTRPAGRVEVFDRTRLILEIFKERARSPEARLQVELAQLTYDMPLVREMISMQKRGERQAAMFGAGEYAADIEYDRMKKRAARIKEDLERIRKERSVRRKHRRRSGFHLVSLAGYTNAGKSTLLKAVSEQHVLAENRYFSTLSTKTARAQSDRRELLVTDTVGFIEDLPPWMVDAFHSTLEEIALADVILLVVDASDALPEMSRRLRSSLRVLWEFVGRDDEPGADRAAFPRRAGSPPVLVALNKADLVPASELDAKRAALEEEGLLSPGLSVALSARSGVGLDALYEKLYALIPDYDEYEVALPPSPESESFLAWLHDHADVLDLTRGNEAHVHFEAKRSLRTELLARLAAVGASPLREVVRDASPDTADEDEAGGRPPGPAS